MACWNGLLISLKGVVSDSLHTVTVVVGEEDAEVVPLSWLALAMVVFSCLLSLSLHLRTLTQSSRAHPGATKTKRNTSAWPNRVCTLGITIFAI